MRTVHFPFQNTLQKNTFGNAGAWMKVRTTDEKEKKVENENAKTCKMNFKTYLEPIESNIWRDKKWALRKFIEDRTWGKLWARVKILRADMKCLKHLSHSLKGIYKCCEASGQNIQSWRMKNWLNWDPSGNFLKLLPVFRKCTNEFLIPILKICLLIQPQHVELDPDFPG